MELLRQEALTGGIGIGVVVGVAIALVIAQIAHKLSRGIAQIQRHLKGRQLARILARLSKGGVKMIALRG